MPNVRQIWHFKPQTALHQEMLNPTIANFFAILLQCNSKVRIALQQYSKIYIYFIPPFSPAIYLSSISLFQFSSLSSLLCFSIPSLLLWFCGFFFFFGSNILFLFKNFVLFKLASPENLHYYLQMCPCFWRQVNSGQEPCGFSPQA